MNQKSIMMRPSVLIAVVAACLVAAQSTCGAQGTGLGARLGTENTFNDGDLYRQKFVEEDDDDEDSNTRQHNNDDDDDDEDSNTRPAKRAPDDSKERFRLLLDRIDKDDDEVVSAAELRDWVQRSHTLLPTLIAEERFTSSDKDGDGLVSWLEHIKDTFDLDGDDDIPKRLKGNYENKKRTIKKIAEDRDLFSSADLDKDGFINREEYYDFNLPEDSEALVPLLIKHGVGDRDQDGDGQLTFEEFISPANTHHDDPDPELAREEFDSVLDQNSDGVLDQDELRRHFLPTSFKLVMEEVEYLIDEADEDDDEQLTFEEMMAYYDAFKRSPVTAYGTHIDNVHDLRDEL